MNKHRLGPVLEELLYTFDKSVTFLVVVVFSFPEPGTLASSLLILLHLTDPKLFPTALLLPAILFRTV